MAQLQQPFNAQQFDPTQGGTFHQLPVGRHPVIITASEVKATSDNTGGMVVYDLEVIDGPGKGQTGPYRVNLYNASDKARSIAESQQSALCYVTGKFLINDTAELHNIPFVVDVEEQILTPQQVAKQAAGEQVRPFTQVKKVLDINCNEPKGNGQAQPAPAPAPVQQQQAPAPAQAAQGAWGGQPTNQAQAPAQAPAAWGGAASAPAPVQPPAQPPAQAWSQAPAAAGQPAWGKR